MSAVIIIALVAFCAFVCVLILYLGSKNLNARVQKINDVLEIENSRIKEKLLLAIKEIALLKTEKILNEKTHLINEPYSDAKLNNALADIDTTARKARLLLDGEGEPDRE